MPSRPKMRRHRKVGLREATIHARPSGEVRTSLKEIFNRAARLR